MTTYELYIAGILCDLDADETVTLRYQSPIFSELDSIQSNRSYNISLPLTARNLQAVGHSQRVDSQTDVPYIKLTAALYMDGVPLFTKGYAVVTDISETINVTLTWGNVDNFQPLFDNNLRDLGPQLEQLGADHIDWNENSEILDANTQNEYPGVAFWGISFGVGIADPKYIHPSVQVSTILEAIEKQHGITIDGKDRLAYSPNLGPIVPLVGKNGDPEFNPVFFGDKISQRNLTTLQFEGKDYANVLVDGYKISTEGVSEVQFTLASSQSKGIVLDLNTEIEDYINLKVFGYDETSQASTALKAYSVQTTFSQKQVTLPIIDEQFNVTQFAYLFVELTIGNGATGADITGFLKIRGDYPEMEDIEVIYPDIFPVAANLPDMAQGDFILALMNMNGLFAYADKDNPDTIRFISIDDIIAKAKAGNILDWSGKVILNDFGRVDMPDASEFSIGDLAQRNILDYDNDDDVTTNTQGVIEIDNVNIGKETELVTLPFSASENATENGATFAYIPIYEAEYDDDGKFTGANYSECSDRILSGRGALINGQVKCVGIFDSWMKFGGNDGIVEARYNSYRRVVDRVRLITVRAKLSALDLYNLDYTRPVYISQFGQLFAIYSVETGDDNICECQLLRIYSDPYYLYLDGVGSNITKTVDNQSQYVNVSVETNGTVKVKSISDPMFHSVTTSADGKTLSIRVRQNDTGEDRTGSVSVTIEEDETLVRTITVTQKSGIEYTLLLDYLPSDKSLVVGAEGINGSTTSVVSTGTAYVISGDLRLQYSLEVDGYKTWSLFINVPVNTSTDHILFDPIVIGVQEDPSLTRKVTITQDAAAERRVILDASDVMTGTTQDSGSFSLANESGNASGPVPPFFFTSSSGYIASFSFWEVAQIMQIDDLSKEVGSVLTYSSIRKPIRGSAIITESGDITIKLENIG